MVCVIMQGDFIAYDDDGCQCEFFDGFTFTIPVDPDYFEYKTLQQTKTMLY